jgi:hypothetical protein
MWSRRIVVMSGLALLAAAPMAVAPAAAQSPPLVVSLSPSFGPVSGGNRVTVYGSQFLNVSSVVFGSTAVRSVHVVSPTQLWVAAPAHPAGMVEVHVTTRDGTSPSQPGDWYTYVAAPVITSVAPTAGPTAGGNTVTVNGANFSGITVVTFGGRAGSLIGYSSGTLTVTAPPHKAGTVDVQVVTAYYTSTPVLADQYTYVAPPSVTAITPAVGPIDGGTRVTVTGAGFVALTAVLFGGAPGTIVAATPTSVTVYSPAHAAATVDVQAVTQFGTSAVVAADHFVYGPPPPPAVISVSPAAGTTRGGTQVTVTGANFLSVTAVTFGGRPGSILTVNPTWLSVLSPSHSAGAIDVQVVSQFGTSPATAADLFTYVAPPTVSAITPAGGPALGGTVVTVTGRNFVNVSAVTFGGVPGDSVTVTSPTSLSVAAPAHAVGTVDVQVVGQYGTSPATTADQFTFIAAWGPPTSIQDLHGQLISVSCPTGTFCMMVDQPGNVLTFDGTSWTPPAPMDPGSGLTGVSCTSSTFCVAVDDSGFSFAWDGTAWSQIGSQTDELAGLTGVSCTSPTFCVSVDQNGNALAFDGTTWTAPAPIDAMRLNAVSCASSTFCVAVSQDGNAITWDGTAWSAPVGLVPMGLVSVSCPTSSFCVALHAVGDLVTWDGTSWSSPTLVDPYGGTSGVSCASATFCMVVDGAGNQVTFDGTTWSAPVQIDDTPFNGLDGVSCPSASFCAAFGSNSGNVLTFDGTTWTAPLKLDERNPINGVSCTSPTFCVAVNGDDGVLTYDGTVWSGPVSIAGRIEYFGLIGVSCTSPSFCVAQSSIGDAYIFDGATWSAAIFIDDSGGPSGVSCTSPSFCVVVDTSGNVVTYDGTSWSPPLLIDAVGPLTSVSCTSPSWCVAVDQSGNAVTFNGTAWSAPLLVDALSPLTSVSCASPSLCVAVDQSGNAVTYNGTAWSPPLAVDPGNMLTGVSCASSAFCVAADQSNNAVMFDGTTWTISNDVAGGWVSCPSTSFCVDVGIDRATIWQ